LLTNRASRSTFAAFVATLLAIGLVGCGPNDGSTVPVLGNAGEYNKALADAESLSKIGLEKIAKDEELNADEKKNLVKAANLFEGLAAYETSNFAPHLALGMIYRGLGNLDVAERHLQQCLLNLPGTDTPEIKETAAEAHYQLARVLFDRQEFDNSLAEASTACDSSPSNPNYIVARASALLQLKREKEARVELDKALALDPENRRGLGLKKLLAKPSMAGA